MAVKLEIILNDNGSITVNGPLNHKIMCYGLMEAAKEVVKDWKPEEKPLIEIPAFQAPTDLSKFGN